MGVGKVERIAPGTVKPFDDPAMPPFRREYPGASADHLWAVAKLKVGNLGHGVVVTVDEKSRTLKGVSDAFGIALTFKVEGNSITVVVGACTFLARGPLTKAIDRVLDKVPEALAKNPPSPSL